MTFEPKKYAIKYAVIYAFFIAVVLLVPLFVYTDLMLNINEAKTELELKKDAYKIISIMDEYNPKESKIFYYPRFKQFQSGLYDKNFRPIFTLINFKIDSFSMGYHKKGFKRYYILKLPDDIYFGAKYLIIGKSYEPWPIYRMFLIISFGIFAILLFFSLIILKNFSKPFEELNKRLDNFIKDSMHEINTPLSIINVNIDLIKRKIGSNKYLDRIKAAVKTLSTIYNDMDYLIKKDKIEYKKEKIDLSRFLEDRIDYFQEIANLRDIKIVSFVQKDIFINFNKTELQRVIENTISNAIKYSKEHSKIEIFLKESDKKIVLNIKDYGIGIKNPTKIFDRYYRENLSKGGFGIGLNIVKNIIDKEGVKLKIISSPQKGSSFIYLFPK